MLKKVFVVLLCGLMFQTMLAADAWALQPNGPVLKGSSLKVSKAVQKIGTGNNALVAVRLWDQSVLSGWISDLGPESFEVTDTNTGVKSQVRFAEVNRLAGMNIVTGDTAQYGVGIRGKLAKVAGVLVPGRRPTGNGFLGTTALLIGIVIGIVIAIVVAKSL